MKTPKKGGFNLVRTGINTVRTTVEIGSLGHRTKTNTTLHRNFVRKTNTSYREEVECCVTTVTKGSQWVRGDSWSGLFESALLAPKSAYLCVYPNSREDRNR